MFNLPRPTPAPPHAAQPHLLHQHIQELESRLTEYRRRVHQDKEEREGWMEVVQRAAALFAGPELEAHVRAEADWIQYAEAEDWMELFRQAQRRVQRTLDAGPPPGAVPVSETAFPQTPAAAPVSPHPVASPNGRTPAAVNPPAVVTPPPPAPPAETAVVESGPSVDFPAVMPVPWWWHWQGQGTIKDNRHHLKRYILERLPSEAPAAPWAWPSAEQSQRVLMLLLLMAETGQVLQRALQVSLIRIAQVQDPWKNSGHLQRDAESLAAAGATETRTVEVATGGRRTPVKLIRLTALGRDWLTSVGRPPVEDDWSRLERLHGGANQETHTHSVLFSTSTLRLWGWQIQVVPTLDGPAQPDFQAQHGPEAPWPGEVERGAGSVERRLTKWRHIADLNTDQPRLILIASNARRLLGLLQEVRTAAPQLEFLAGQLGGLFLPRNATQAERPPLVHIQPDEPLTAARLEAAPLAPPTPQESPP